MAITDESVERPLPPSVRVGELAMRYKFSGQPDSQEFDIDILLGELDDADPEYVEEFAAYAVTVRSAARIVLVRHYDHAARDIDPATRQGTSFAYGKPLLLPGLISAPEDRKSSVDQLMDNEALRSADLLWQASVIGFDGIRAMQRALFVARNATELDQPVTMKVPTDPEVRVDMLSYIGGRAMDIFMAMPPSPR